MLVGGYTPDQGTGTGISVLGATDGVPDALLRSVPAVSPSFLARHPRLPVLYAVAEVDEGGIVAWSCDELGPVAEIGRGDTGGAAPCHLAVAPAGDAVVTVNYGGGSIAVHRLEPDGRIGERTDLVQHEDGGPHERQDGAHTHMVRIDGDDVLVTDLGGDAVHHYTLRDGRLARRSVTVAPAASGPRHVTRAGDRWYLSAELAGTVLVYDAGWNLLGQVPASRSAVESMPSEILTDATGTYLYLANRGPDTITVFALDDDLPRYVDEVPVGTWPRHIALDGDLLYCANQYSDEVTTLRIDPETGVPAPVATFAVPSPTCVLP